jgi:hypothetical protein
MAPKQSPKVSSKAPPLLSSARSILRGELDRVGLPTLLTIMEMERRTGILVLSRPRQLGRLHIRDGHIIRAAAEGAGRQTGAEAVFQMLNWPDGQFELWHTEVEGRDEIQQRTTFLLIEGMRRIDEGVGEGAQAVRVYSEGVDAPANDVSGNFQIAF